MRRVASTGLDEPQWVTHSVLTAVVIRCMLWLMRFRSIISTMGVALVGVEEGAKKRDKLYSQISEEDRHSGDAVCDGRG
jgi:hypothetical protein